MIDRLENVGYIEQTTDKYGNVIHSARVTRIPNNEEIVEKVNEIIDYINAKEIESNNDRIWKTRNR